jgi:hypothetical protein
MSSWWNDHKMREREMKRFLMKWRVNEMTIYWYDHDIIRRQNEMTSGWNDQWRKWPVDEMTSGWNDQWMKWLLMKWLLMKWLLMKWLLMKWFLQNDFLMKWFFSKRLFDEITFWWYDNDYLITCDFDEMTFWLNGLLVGWLSAKIIMSCTNLLENHATGYSQNFLRLS